MEAIEAAAAAAWATAAAGVPLALVNEPLPTSDTFAALTVQLTTGAQTTSGPRGTRRTRRDGWIQIKLWSPAGAGMTRSAAEVTAGVLPKLSELADLVRGIVEETTFGASTPDPVTTLAASSTPVVTDGRWAMTVVRVPFWYAETK